MDLYDFKVNEQHSFCHFFAGRQNTLLYKVCVGLSSGVNHELLPLLLLGDSGTGKSHLLDAIHLNIARQFPEKKILHISGQDIITLLINAIEQENLALIEQACAPADVLIIDDLSGLEGKRSTQQVFCNIFNHLQRSGKQMFFSSSKSRRPDRYSPEFIGRLYSGLVLRVFRPDFDTCKRIAADKAKLLGVPISDAAVERIAKQSGGNGFFIEGAVKQRKAYLKFGVDPDSKA